MELYVEKCTEPRTQKISENFLSFSSHIDWSSGSWFFNHSTTRKTKSFECPLPANSLAIEKKKQNKENQVCLTITLLKWLLIFPKATVQLVSVKT